MIAAPPYRPMMAAPWAAMVSRTGQSDMSLQDVIGKSRWSVKLITWGWRGGGGSKGRKKRNAEKERKRAEGEGNMEEKEKKKEEEKKKDEKKEV